jgi:hypothetical protein
MEVTQASYNVLFWKVTEHSGQCVHRSFWRNENGTVAQRKRDASALKRLTTAIPVQIHVLLSNASLSVMRFVLILHHYKRSAIARECTVYLAEIKCINVRRNTTVFSNCWRKQLHVSALFWVGHHQVETRISENSQTFRRRGTLDLAFHISRYPLRKTPIFLNWFTF